MLFVRKSSVEEYVAWYLQRAKAKGDSSPIPDTSEQKVYAMRIRHSGKMRAWFNESTQWHIVQLNNLEDLANLIFLECDWTRLERLVIPDGLNYRLLRRVAENALASNYLSSLPSEHPEHKSYYHSLAGGSLQLHGKDRIAICSAEPSEMKDNPAAHHYLLDGVGRCLPYMILLLERKLSFMPVEAFLASRLT